ncbi:cylicin-1 [Pteronotus mesoamericanus]|uniref:cylicin-1 n=1 Tax=Pteronotus mesoamericanus TaxID=1884717 RepID=UPI0023EDD538|nr:cylicin-1 [Pteronotus parnellii mesoamericanus]
MATALSSTMPLQSNTENRKRAHRPYLLGAGPGTGPGDRPSQRLILCGPLDAASLRVLEPLEAANLPRRPSLSPASGARKSQHIAGWGVGPAEAARSSDPSSPGLASWFLGGGKRSAARRQRPRGPVNGRPAAAGGGASLRGSGGGRGRSGSTVLQEANIKACNNSLQISESSRKLCHEEYFTLSFPKPPQPGREKRSRLSELQTSIPGHQPAKRKAIRVANAHGKKQNLVAFYVRQQGCALLATNKYDKRKLEEVHTPAQIWIRYFLRKKCQRPSNYFTVRRQDPFSLPYTPKTHSEKAESEKSEESKKNTGPHEKTPESKKMANDKKPKRGAKTDKTLSKSSHESELSKKLKYKPETNPESKDSKVVLVKDPRKSKRDFKIFKKTNIKSICTRKNSKSPENNSDAKSEAYSKNSSNIDLMISLEESGAESMEFDTWLNNCSQNNSKKTSKKEANKSSDTESLDSKDGKKGNKGIKKGKKKVAKKDTESTDESASSKDEKKGLKKVKKDPKKINKKKESKDTETTGTESESELDSKKAKKDSKNKKGSRKDSKKMDAKEDTVSTDGDPESDVLSKSDEKDEKVRKRGSKKGDKKKSAIKSEESSEIESDSDSKMAKRSSRESAKKQKAKNIESSDAESEDSSKKEPKKTGLIKSSDAESDDSMHRLGAQNKGAEESDGTSADSKKGVLGQKRDIKTSFRRTTFRGKEKAVTGRFPPPRRSPTFPPFPLEPIILSPKIKRPCQCKMQLPPPKPRYAPLPEAKWIHKLL